MMNILLAGVGGQGTVLASKLLAQAAINIKEALPRPGVTGTSLH